MIIKFIVGSQFTVVPLAEENFNTGDELLNLLSKYCYVDSAVLYFDDGAMLAQLHPQKNGNWCLGP